jgi:hypothetical protein
MVPLITLGTGCSACTDCWLNIHHVRRRRTQWISSNRRRCSTPRRSAPRGAARPPPARPAPPLPRAAGQTARRSLTRRWIGRRGSTGARGRRRHGAARGGVREPAPPAARSRAAAAACHRPALASHALQSRFTHCAHPAPPLAPAAACALVKPVEGRAQPRRVVGPAPRRGPARGGRRDRFGRRHVEEAAPPRRAHLRRRQDGALVYCRKRLLGNVLPR